MFDPSNSIHPSAILEGDIQLGTDNVIGPHAVLRGTITLGSGNSLGPGVVIENHVRIGSGNRIHAYACIGAMGEMGLKGDELRSGALVRIGDGCTIREHVVIHSPVYAGVTAIGDHAYLMNHAYVAHDGQIGDRVVLSHGAALGGRCVVDDDATVGMLAALHQRVRIGRGAMIGMAAVITRPVLPFSKVAGNPGRLLGANLARFEALGIPDASGQAIARLLADPAHPSEGGADPWVTEILDFMAQHPDCLVTSRHAE